MELVIDANILISALIKDSHTRHFLLFSEYTFFVPEFIFEEINEHIEELKSKTLLTETELKEIHNKRSKNKNNSFFNIQR